MSLLEPRLPEPLHGMQVHVWRADGIKPIEIGFREQILLGAREPEMLEFVSEDATGRFVDENAYKEWARAGQVMIGLARNNQLGGVVWFDREQDGRMHTQIRMYESMRGQKLALPFLTVAHQVVVRYVDTEHGFVATIDEQNERALYVMKTFGYAIESALQNPVTMTYDEY